MVRAGEVAVHPPRGVYETGARSAELDERATPREAVVAAGEFAASGASERSCLVIVPTYNEALNIKRLIAEILQQGPRFDVLVVDDNSPDGTGDVVAAIAAQTPRVQLLRRSGKLGLGTAYLAGFAAGLQRGYAFLCEMDADFSHQPHYLPALLDTAEHRADVALGSRNVPGGRVENWSWVRKLISRGGSLYARLILGLPVRDVTGGFKCFRREVLARLDLDQIGANGYGFQVEMNYLCHRAGFRLAEIPIVFPDRTVGQSKMSGAIVLEAATIVWKLRFRALADRFAARPLPHTAVTAASPESTVPEDEELVLEVNR